MGEIASVQTAVSNVAPILAALAGGTPTYTTGDVEWTTTSGYVYAFNASGYDVALVFIYNSNAVYGPTLPGETVTIPANTSVGLSGIVEGQFNNGSVTMCSTGAGGSPLPPVSGDLGGSAVGKAVALGVSSLPVGVGAALINGVTFSITVSNDGATAQLEFQYVPSISGPFTATITNGSSSATVSGTLGGSGSGYGYEATQTFELPTFLGIGDDVVDWIEVVLVVPESYLPPAAATARVFRGRPPRANQPG